MRFAFSHRPFWPYTNTINLVRYGEELGYDYAWQPDQQFFQDPFVMLTACALKTSRIRLGVAVTNPFTRHPALIARAIGLLDEIAEGRAVLGIGGANRRQVLQPLGLDTGRTAARVREAIQIIRQLWAGERVTCETPTVTIRGVALNFKTRPDIPIFVGTHSPLVLKAAGELADGVLIEALLTPGGLDFAFEHLRAGRAKANRPASEQPVLCWQLTRIVDRKADILPRVAPFVAHLIAPSPDAMLERIGIRPEVIGPIREAYAAGGPEGAASLVTEVELDKMALIGPKEEVIERIHQMRAMGIDGVSLLLLWPYEECRETLRRFADEIFPHVRS